MKITKYLNDYVTHERRATPGSDQWGKPLFLPAETLRCRHTVRAQLLEFSDGLEIASVDQYMSEAPVGIGDRVNGQIIRAVSNTKDGRGNSVMWKSYPAKSG